ncbi:MAG: DJ-1/PfpI family protein [Oscillospiraceae bacterium]
MGSCIEEVILTYAALDRYGCDYTPVAEDISVPSVNHLTEQLADNRNVLLESARIGRGRIKSICGIDFEEYDTLIIPGGISLLNNYRASSTIEACIAHFSSRKKPIATMCAGIDFMRRFLGGSLLEHETNVLTAEKFCFDADNNIYYTPAFKKNQQLLYGRLGYRFHDLCVEACVFCNSVITLRSKTERPQHKSTVILIELRWTFLCPQTALGIRLFDRFST